MIEKLYIVTDLGPGDGGKGGVVQFLSHYFRSFTSVIIKEGGAQGSHGVVTSTGEKFNFSQWGCGTLEGVPTYLSERFVISPIGLFNEANALQHFGIYDPFDLLIVHPGCLVATPYHQAWSQLDEILRRDSPRGTVGTGVGKAYRDSKRHSEFALFAEDLVLFSLETLKEKLDAQREHIRIIFEDKTEEDVLLEDRELFNSRLKILAEDDNILNDIAKNLHEVGKKLKLLGLGELLEQKNTLGVVERSHGVLTDAECGLKPHVSALRTLPKFSEEMYREAGFDGEIRHLGVHRAYEIRHGAGPMPSHDPAMGDLLPGSHKSNNRFQGEVRVGPLDVILLKYAIEQCRDTPLDCLCLTWFDQVLQSGTWSFCTGYRIDDRIERCFPGLVESIFKVTDYDRHDLSVDVERLQDKSYLLDFVSETMKQYVTLPVRLVSYGATEADKIFK